MATVGAGWYREGSVDVTQGSKTVVGTGTLWGVQARKGDLFSLIESGRAVYFYEIDAITDNTHLELVNPYAETTATAQSYAIIRNFNTTMTSETNARLVSFISEWKLALQQNLRGDKGDPGDDGNTIYSNNGTPAAGLGTDDDWCIDYSNWNMYRKEAGAWVLRGNIKGATGDAGADGAVWFTAETDPIAATGQLGDYALNTLSGDVFRRGSGGWVKEGNLKGVKGDTGAQGPQGATGPKGDTGTAGSRWHSVTGTPSTSLGVDTDMAVDTATGSWYRKESGAWSLKGNIKGPKGDKGDTGDPGVNWRGAWDATTEYAVRDGVYYNGSSFVALQTSTGQTPPDPATGGDSYWLVVARRGIDGMGAGDMLRTDYDSNSDGKVNAADMADVATYATTAGRATVADSADAADWNNLTSRPESFPPESHGLAVHTGATLAELNAMITDADVPSDALATTSTDGLMSAADKTVLDRLTEDVASKGYVDAAVSPWKTGPAFSRASDATFTVTDNAANQAIFAKGRPIRYRETAGTWRYGMVDGYSSGTVTLVGAPMTESDDDEMEYGDPNRVAQVEFFVGGKFADAANTGLLASDAKTFFSWGLTAGFLVRIRHRVARDDSGANQPQVTVSIRGSVVGTDNTNAGLAVAESWTSTTTGINVSNYDIAMGDAMEVVTDANGSNDDAYDLTVSCTFVLE